MPRWPISDDRAREMYAGGRPTAMLAGSPASGIDCSPLVCCPRRWVTMEVPGRIAGRVDLGAARHG